MSTYIRYSSLGLIWAWVYCSWKTELLFPGMKGTNILSDPSWLANVVLVIAFLFATPMLARRLGPQGRRKLILAATAAMPVGVCGSAAFAGSTGSMVALSCASGMLTGFGSAVLIAVSGAQLTRLPLEGLERVIFVNLLYAPLCTLFVPALEGTAAGVLFVAALPVAAGALVLSLPDMPAAKIDPPSSWAIFPRPAAGEVRTMLSCCLLFHVASALIIFTRSMESIPGQFNSLSDFFQANLALGSVITLAVCYLFMTHSRHLDFANACRFSVSPMLVGTVLLLVGSLPIVFPTSSALISFSSTYFSLITYIVFIKLAKMGVLGPYEALGRYMGYCELGVLLANFAGMGIATFLDGPLHLPAQVALIGIALALMVFIDPVYRTAATPAMSTQSTAAEVHLEGPQQEDSDIDKRDPFAAIAAAHGLTARETEICSLVAQGRSRPYIRELLCVSKNTVDSHVKHAYAKLGIHSNQELIDLIQREKTSI